MLWFTVWTVLVLGTLAGVFLVGRRLWHAVVDLGAELSRAGEVADELARRTADLVEQARQAQVEVRPALGDDPQVQRDRVEQLRAERRERQADRRARHRTTVTDAASRWLEG